MTPVEPSPTAPTDFDPAETPRRVHARACCRVDLGGGTLDIWPLGLLIDSPGTTPACTVNLAVDVEVTVELARREEGWDVCLRSADGGEERREADHWSQLREHTETSLVGVVAEALDLPPCAVVIDSASPRGGGLGASSAIAVCLIAAGQTLLGLDPSDPACRAGSRAHLARDLEARMMELPTGAQDHYPALLGGALVLEHRPGAEVVRRLDVDLEALGKHLVVAFTGVSHFSAGQNWQVVRRRLEGEPEVRGLLAGIGRTAAQLPAALEAADWPRVGELVGQEWSHRRHLATGVTTPEIDHLLGTAHSLGAWGAKACGAGGGGCVVIVAPPERCPVIAESLERSGAEILPARPSPAPLRVRPRA